MKKLLVLLFVLTCLVGQTYAQNEIIGYEKQDVIQTVGPSFEKIMVGDTIEILRYYAQFEDYDLNFDLVINRYDVCYAIVMTSSSKKFYMEQINSYDKLGGDFIKLEEHKWKEIKTGLTYRFELKDDSYVLYIRFPGITEHTQ